MFGRKKKQPSMDLTPAEALEQARSGKVVLVDVREIAERDALAPQVRSMHLPGGELEARIDELPKDRPVAFLCKSGRRSAKAAETARAAGLRARNVAGGMDAWSAQGLPTLAEDA